MGLKDALGAASNAMSNAVNNARNTEKFDSLGVTVRDGQVYEGRRVAGTLAGAQAELTDTVKKHRVGSAAVLGVATLGVGAVVGLSRRKEAFAYATFADGNYIERKIKGKDDIQKAQRDVVKFNALARGATS
jgi:hypothetical protein